MVKDNIQLIAEEIMGKKHVQDVNVILEAMHREISANAYRSLRGSGMGGLTRPISPNEIISRAFNLARGMVSPAYVASEFAVRVSLNASMDMVKMAAGDPDAARVLKDVLLYPENMNKVKLNEFQILMQDFLVSELARANVTELPQMTMEYFGFEGEE